MADINLLPDDFKRDEQRAKERARKKSSQEDPIRLTEPENGGEDTTTKLWKKVLGKENAPSASSGKRGTPLEQAVAKSFSKKVRKTPDFLTDDVSEEEGRARVKDKEAQDIFDDGFEYEETQGEKQAKSLRKQSPLREGEKLSQDKDNAPNILIEKDEDTQSLLARLKKIQKAIVDFFGSFFGRYSGKGVEVNLMPEQAMGLQEVNWKKIVTNFASVIVISVLIIIAGYTGILSRIRNEERNFNNLQLSVDDLTAQILAFSEQQARAFAIEQELSDAKGVLNNHIYWTQFLHFLERTTLSSVRYNSFDGLVDSPITLVASADDLETVLLQRKMFEDAPEVANVILVSYTKDEDGAYEFELLITLDQAVWRRS